MPDIDYSKVEAIVEDANTPSDVRSFLQDAVSAVRYIDSVNVDDEGVVTRKDPAGPGQTNLEGATGSATAPVATPVASGDTAAVQVAPPVPAEQREESQDERISRLESELAAARGGNEPQAQSVNPPTGSESPSSPTGTDGGSGSTSNNG